MVSRHSQSNPCSRIASIVFKLAEVLKRVLWRSAALGFLLLLTTLSFITGRTVYVIVSPFGNLGNRLFLFANLIAHSILTRSITINVGFGPWRRSFSSTRCGALPVFSALPLPHFAGESLGNVVQKLASVAFFIAKSPRFAGLWGSLDADHYDTIYLDSPLFREWSSKKAVVLLRGYNFIARNTMQHTADQIRPYFVQVVGNDSEALAPVHRLRGTCDRIIGVVIRQSGFDQWMGGRYFFSLQNYFRWIRETAGLWPESKVGFFICCDSTIDLSLIADLTYEFRAQHDLENRAALACCDLILAPPSSYAAWAAFMANIRVQVLVSIEQSMTLDGFQQVFNHTDLAPEDYPRIDITPTLVKAAKV